MPIFHILLLIAPFFSTGITIAGMQNYLCDPVTRWEHRHHMPELYANAALILIAGIAVTCTFLFAVCVLVMRPILGG